MKDDHGRTGSGSGSYQLSEMKISLLICFAVLLVSGPSVSLSCRSAAHRNIETGPTGKSSDKDSPTASVAGDPKNHEQSGPCGEKDLPCEAYWGSPIVFIGKVLEVKPVNRSSPPAGGAGELHTSSEVRFEVEKRYRGAKESQMQIDNQADTEGRSFEFIIGERYVVFAQANFEGSRNAGLVSRNLVSRCTATRLASLATEEIRYAEEQSAKYPDDRMPGVQISNGLLQGRAVSLPLPTYPQAAKEAAVSGRVYVLLTVDEKGKVIAAEAVCGQPLLKEAALAAARQAQFSPTLVSGVPAKVSGLVVYNFTR